MIKTPLRDYQEVARDKAVPALRRSGGFLLIPEQRTGKCLISLAVVDLLKPNYLVIVCPKAAMKEWEKQIPEHLERDWNCQITIINFEQMVLHRKEWYKWIKRVTVFPVMIICDESHFIKKRGAQRSRVVRHVGHSAQYRLALTGTPMGQGREDVWAQMDFVNQEVFGTWEKFDRDHLIWGGYKKHEIVAYRNEAQFDEKFHENSYRITLRKARKEPLRLQFSKHWVEMSYNTQRHYDEMFKGLLTIVNGKKVKAKNVLAQVMKLQQITGGMLLENGRQYPIGYEKLEALHTIVRSLQARTKFIIVARFIHEIILLETYLIRLGCTVTVVKGGQPYSGEFKTDCIIMQIQSGISRDMSAADTMIFYSMDYSYLNFEQSRFRILSYDKPYAKFIFLLARDSIDEVIFEAVTSKKNLARLVCDRYRDRRTSVKETSIRN